MLCLWQINFSLSLSPAQPPSEDAGESKPELLLHLLSDKQRLQSLLRQLLSDSESPQLPGQFMEAGTNLTSHVKMELPTIAFYS